MGDKPKLAGESLSRTFNLIYSYFPVTFYKTPYLSLADCSGSLQRLSDSPRRGSSVYGLSYYGFYSSASREVPRLPRSGNMP